MQTRRVETFPGQITVDVINFLTYRETIPGEDAAVKFELRKYRNNLSTSTT